MVPVRPDLFVSYNCPLVGPPPSLLPDVAPAAYDSPVADIFEPVIFD